MQALMGWTHLRSQITAQEKWNVDLTASNATLRKSNEKLTAKLEELKNRNEELSSNNNKLVDQNARILGQLDEVKEELHVEKATTASLLPSGLTASERPNPTSRPGRLCPWRILTTGRAR